MTTLSFFSLLITPLERVEVIPLCRSMWLITPLTYLQSSFSDLNMTTTPRYREKGLQSPSTLPNSVVGYGPNPMPFAVGVEFVGCQSGTYQYMIDFPSRPFRKSSDPSKWVFNPLTIALISARASSGSATTSNIPDSQGRGLTRMWSGDGVGFLFGALVPTPKSLSFGSFPDLLNSDRLKQLAIIGCLSKINPAQSQTLVTAAEAHKSVDMILSRAKKLADTMRACRAGNLAKLKDMYPGKQTKRYPKRVVLWDDSGRPITRKNGKVVSKYSHTVLPPSGPKDSVDKLWLEFRYGWSPLIHDIVDQLKAINAQLLRDDLTKLPFIRVVKRESGSSSSVTPLLRPNFAGGDWRGTQTLTHKVEVKAYAKYTVKNESGIMNRLNDFGAFDVPLLLWEVVPFSFVVDWFVPIGDWLSAISPKVGVEVIESGVSMMTSKEVTRVLDGYTPSLTGAGSWPSAPFPLGTSDSFLTVSKTRTIGLPTPWFPTPDVKLNLKRLVDAVALLKSVRR